MHLQYLEYPYCVFSNGDHICLSVPSSLHFEILSNHLIHTNKVKLFQPPDFFRCFIEWNPLTFWDCTENEHLKAHHLGTAPALVSGHGWYCELLDLKVNQPWQSTLLCTFSHLLIPAPTEKSGSTRKRNLSFGLTLDLSSRTTKLLMRLSSKKTLPQANQRQSRAGP